MIKQAPSFARIAAMVIFAFSCFVLMLFLWVRFGGPTPLKPQGYRVTATFPEAIQLAHEADVRMSGVTIGKVKKIDVSPGGSKTVLEVDSRYVPLPSDVNAILRQKTLLGETYVELTPGTKGKGVPPITDGGRIRKSQISTGVQLDEVLRLFDVQTRANLRGWFIGQSGGIRGRGEDFNAVIGTLPLFLSNTNSVLEVFAQNDPELRKLVSNSSDLFEAFRGRDKDIAGLIQNSHNLLQVTAKRNQEFADIFRELPGFISESKTTVERLDSFERNTSGFIDQATEIANEISPTLIESAKVTGDTRKFFENLDPLLKKADTGLPKLDRFVDESEPVLAQLDPFLRNLNPVLEFVGQYKREITAFLANDAAATQGINSKDRTGLHTIRAMTNVSPNTLAYAPTKTDKTRTNAYPAPGFYDNLATGLQVFESAHCAGVPVPPLNPAPDPNLSDELRALIKQIIYAGDDTAPLPAPGCTEQPAQSFSGETTQYPHVRERSTP